MEPPPMTAKLAKATIHDQPYMVPRSADSPATPRVAREIESELTMAAATSRMLSTATGSHSGIETRTRSSGP